MRAHFAGLCLWVVASSVGSILSAREAGARDYLKKPAAWFASAEAKTIAENILSHQAPEGGWPKNTDVVSKRFEGDKKTLKGTFDNGATTDELRFLAHMYGATKDGAYVAPFNNGLDHIFKAQFDNGGWPQYYPLSKQYHRHITFNDDAMVRLMEFLREVSTHELFSFVDRNSRKSAADAFERGVDCILKCQIRVDGKPTVWCAQHDEITLEPRPARAYELASFSGAESVGIVRLLMSLDLSKYEAAKAAEIRAAIQGAVAWFEAAKLKGIRVDLENDPKGPKGKNKVVVADEKALPLWARFYDLKTGKPFFCDRDGVAKPNLSDIGYERRNGYAWYGNWPQKLIEVEFPAWQKK